jgi:two-component system LytT family response regulator
VTPIRTLLVDDEQPARERLRQLLAASDDVEIVGEAEDGVQALERIQELTPDLVLLDIQMPGCSGLEVAASLGRPRPAIVFCTAFDQHAVDAFELHAGRASERDREIDHVTRHDRLTPARFLARKAARFRVVPRQDVIAFTFQEGLTRLHTATEQLWMQPTLAALARRLDGGTFFQVSRTAIISLDAIREAKPFPDGTGEVVMSNAMVLPVTRRRWRMLMERLEQ